MQKEKTYRSRAKKSLGLKSINGFARAKKTLGQNFLKSQLALRKIVEAGEIQSDDIILEIGPGRGALTEKLLAQVSEGSSRSPRAKVIAVEKDRELFEFLQNKFEKEIKSNTLVLVCEDILEFDVSEKVFKFLAWSGWGRDPENRGPDKNLKTFRYKVIANIPYNITGAILKKFLTATNQPERMVLMLQSEVARRIIGSGGKAKLREMKSSGVARSAKSGFRESILSISVKAYGEPKMIMKVPARYFSPAPKVDSAVISIKNISRKRFGSPLEEYPSGGGGRIFSSLSQGEGEGVMSIHPGAAPQEGNVNEEKFWQIVKAGFAHKRKKLSSNLKNISLGLGLTLSELGNKRAEDLTVLDWISLAR